MLGVGAVNVVVAPAQVFFWQLGLLRLAAFTLEDAGNGELIIVDVESNGGIKQAAVLGM
jgi:hypothetical protein